MCPFGVPRGSIVVLKALPKESLLVKDAEVSKFSHWSGGAAEGKTGPILRITVSSDMEITAHLTDQVENRKEHQPREKP